MEETVKQPVSRRKFIKRLFWGSLGLLLVDSLWFEKFFIETNEFNLGTQTDSSQKIKAVQISDLHLQSIGYKIKNLAAKINAIKADIIFITGDAIDDKNNLAKLKEFMLLLDSSVKKVAITGNWEYWGKVNIEDLESVYTNANCDLLLNQSREYVFGNKKISVTGLDDYVGGSADILKALEEFNKTDFHVILNHCPQYSNDIAQNTTLNNKADLILSGHTHGGQINLFGFVPFLPQGSGSYLKGWYTGERLNMYVSKGIGTSIFPARFMARAEIAVFNIYV